MKIKNNETMNDLENFTPNFSFKEMTRTDTGIENIIPQKDYATIVGNIDRLCRTVLEPVRRMLDVPMIVTSGYRSKKVNEAVGGVKNSMHLHGCACDFTVGEKHKNVLAWHLIKTSQIPFDVVILEKNGEWIHISIARNGKNRRLAIENK